MSWPNENFPGCDRFREPGPDKKNGDAMNIIFDIQHGYYTGRPYLVIEDEGAPALASFRTQEEAEAFLLDAQAVDALAKQDDRDAIDEDRERDAYDAEVGDRFE